LIDLFLSRIITIALRRYTSLDVRDYFALLHLAHNYRIIEVYVNQDDWVAERSIHELRLNDEGVLILGIQRAKGNFIGAPTSYTKIQIHDTLTVYGAAAACERIDKRKRGEAGDREHEEAVEFHNRVRRVEKVKDATTVPE
jgi:uncharacterized protein with PhoU and TrkA domain